MALKSHHAGAISHMNGAPVTVTHTDPTHGNVMLLDIFGNPSAWIEDRYQQLDARWVQAGLAEDVAYRDAAQAGLTQEPAEGWTPNPALRAWRNNVGPTTAKDPSVALNVPGTNVPKYMDGNDATRRTAYWFNMERKWKMCKYVFVLYRSMVKCKDLCNFILCVW
jgi:hypothetical protein